MMYSGRGPVLNYALQDKMALGTQLTYIEIGYTTRKVYLTFDI